MFNPKLRNLLRVWQRRHYCCSGDQGKPGLNFIDKQYFGKIQETSENGNEISQFEEKEMRSIDILDAKPGEEKFIDEQYFRGQVKPSYHQVNSDHKSDTTTSNEDLNFFDQHFFGETEHATDSSPQIFKTTAHDENKSK